jgi:hypothetical protein
MADGRWSAQFQEELQQSQLERERFLTVNTGPTLNVEQEASAFASFDPSGALITDKEQGAPHFILSPRTPDGAKTFGFRWSLHQEKLGAPLATAGAGGFTVTWWRLLTNLSMAGGSVWASFLPVTLVALKSTYHTFDCNACALRCQITNLTVDGAITIAICEL